MAAREVVAGPAIEGQRSNLSNQRGGRRWDRCIHERPDQF